jgi:amino acid adenylation domain-containing protein
MAESLPRLIDSAAERHPQRQAIGYLDSSLSYAELAERSNQLANVLLEDGVKKGDRVGIYMDKRLETAVAMYGIMKAGAAYVPVDPAAPDNRFAALINDCDMKHLVAAPDKHRRLTATGPGLEGIQSVIGVQPDDSFPFRSLSWDDVAGASANPPGASPIGSDDLAYLIYTSGSTGQPKGIMHTHSSGMSFAAWAAAEYGLRADDRLGNHAPLHFDLSIFDFFAGAVAGATTVLVPEEYTKLPASYSQLLQDQEITVLFTVPFALIQLLLRGALEDRDLSSLRWIIFGGEPFPAKHLRNLMRRLPHIRFDNMYGPAEVNGCTHYTIPSPDDIRDSVPIGPICSIATARVVDEDDQPVPTGQPGELLVRTPTMMRGYWRRPDLNRQAFWNDPTHQGNVYYRTGDLVVEREDGLFHFLGRKDRQVKVRGYRIELDEIEAALTSHDDVEEAAAFIVPDIEGNKAVHCVVTLKTEPGVSSAELRTYAKQLLPWFALPAKLTIQSDFPRTTTGKIDRRKLSENAVQDIS